MALHFDLAEFDARKAMVTKEMEEQRLDAMLLFAPESHYWLTGYDTFGYCFFQCLILTQSGEFTLFTRSADLRQAEHTSLIADIRVWDDGLDSHPAQQLRDLLVDIDLLGSRVGVEYDTHGLTAFNGRALDDALTAFGTVEDQSNLVSRFRVIKSEAELTYVRRAAELADKALEAGLNVISAGADEALVLAEMQSAILAEGGDYPGNPFVIGSGKDALLCRTKSGRRILDKNDQITLEFAGVYRLYHSALMETVIVGEPTDRHLELRSAASEALVACEDAMRPGKTFGDVYAAHAEILDDCGLMRHRLNACGYSLGTRYAPSWMDWPMFYRNNSVEIEPNMVLFAHMILMDSSTGTAMTHGRTYVTTDNDPICLSNSDRGLLVR